jgi:hypothetical protein
MTRYIELIDDESGTRAVATLFDAAAPATCNAIWAALETPLQAKALHAMHAGREIMLEFPEVNRRFDPEALPKENMTITPLPGEIGFLYFPARTFIDLQRPDDSDRSSAFWDFAIFYGRDVRLLTVLGFQPAPIFAAITENLEAFAKCCERVRSEGRKPFTVRRVEQKLSGR